MREALKQSKQALQQVLDELAHTALTPHKTLADNRRLYQLLIEFEARIAVFEQKTGQIEAELQAPHQAPLQNRQELDQLTHENARLAAALKKARSDGTHARTELAFAEQRAGHLLTMLNAAERTLDAQIKKCTDLTSAVESYGELVETRNEQIAVLKARIAAIENTK